MALPPWTVELLRRGVQDLARQVSDPELVQSIKDQASRVVDELPRVAREKVDSLLRQAEATTTPLREMLLSTMSASPSRRLINASGDLFSAHGSGIAVASEVLAAGLEVLLGEVTTDPATVERDRRVIADAVSAQLGQPIEVAVCGSLSHAIAMLAPLGRRGGRLLVPRCCAVPLGEPGSPVLADAIRSTGGVSLREIGETSGCRFDHVATAVADAGGSSWLVRLPKPCCAIDAEQLATVSVRQIVVLDHGRLLGSETTGNGGRLTAIPIASNELARGADVVLLRGGALTGTPSVGLIVARPEAMSALRQSRRWSIGDAPAAYVAMVAAAVRLASRSELPIDKLLDASEPNLHDRADRLATQLSGIASLTEVRVTNDPVSITTAIGAPALIPSRQVTWSVDDASRDRTCQRLVSGEPSVIVRLQPGAMSLDLRWVSPDQQGQLAERVERAVG